MGGREWEETEGEKGRRKKHERKRGEKERRMERREGEEDGEERRRGGGRGEKERREGERGSLEIVHELLRGVGQLTLDDWFDIRLDKGLGILLALDEVLHCHRCLYLLVYISHDLTIDLNPVLFYILRSQST